jgi:DNA sulfur modification protein DndD
LQLLAHKEGLVGGVEIDRTTLDLRVRDQAGRWVERDRLSAGEQHLLAVALLWGLASASGRPLPVVIDTPLGRLDAEHRRRLLDRYFPHASHQVILLATDAELDAGHLAALRARDLVECSYLIRYDADRRASVVEPGYFR